MDNVTRGCCCNCILEVFITAADEDATAAAADEDAADEDGNDSGVIKRASAVFGWFVAGSIPGVVYIPAWFEQLLARVY